MRCLHPRTVSFLADGKTISWSPKKYSKEFAPFQLPCGKCIECRLEYGRQWAVRCVHEAQMHENNVFITLTYEDVKLPKKLVYEHFQNFIKRLRQDIIREYATPSYWASLSESDQSQFIKDHKETLDTLKIGYFVTGEYGEKEKRPHWHAIIFNWAPKDMEYHFTTDNGDKIYKSSKLDSLWGYNNPEKAPSNIGSVTFESAGYCARYAAKKLIHGRDQDHDFHPISKKSSKQAIGKKWLEKYWPDVFNYGHVILTDGQKTTIPRYYEKWLQKHQPAAWENYITTLKADRCLESSNREHQRKASEAKTNEKRFASGNIRPQITKHAARKQIIEQKFKQLQKHLKGDI